MNLIRKYIDSNRSGLWWGIPILISIPLFYFVSPIILEIFGQNYLNNQNRLTATSIFSTTILTFGLIIIYKNISDIQSKQTELMEAEYRPLIDIGLISFRDMLMIGLINPGNGTAFDPVLKTELDFESEYITTEETREGLRTVPRQNEIYDSSANKVFSKHGIQFSELRSTIPPDNRTYLFDCKLFAKISKDGEEIVERLSYIIEILFSEDVSRVRANLSIEVTDINDQKHEFEIFQFSISEKNYSTKNLDSAYELEHLLLCSTMTFLDEHSLDRVPVSGDSPESNKTTDIMLRMSEEQMSIISNIYQRYPTPLAEFFMEFIHNSISDE